MRPADRRRRCFRKTEVLDLTFLNQVLHRSSHIFNRYLWITAVLIEEIDYAPGAAPFSFTLKRTGVPFLDGLKTTWRSRLWNRNTILPGLDSSVALSEPGFHDPT